MRSFARAGLVLAFLLALPAVALATQVQALTLRQLVEGADRIVVATVVDQEAHYDDLDRIVTDSTLRVDETLHGTATDTIVVRHIGGVVGGLGLTVAGEGRYAEGATMLLFLRTFESGDAGPVMRPIGMSQGEMPIVPTTAGEMVLPGGAGLSIVTLAPDGRLVPSIPAMSAPMARDALLVQVRDLVAEVYR